MKDESDHIRRDFLALPDPALVFERRSALVEQLVVAAYRDCLEHAYSRDLAVLSVGGFGRRELSPHSDVDILILEASEDADKARREALSRFIQRIWDSGLRLSHSVHTVRECCEVHETNIELNISLLDQRFLAGDASLYAQLDQKLPKFYQSQKESLARHLCRLTHKRHSKYQDTIYHLEPHIKDCPGGIRDLHLIGWLAKLWGTPGVEAHELQDAARFLSTLRCYLHYWSGRDNNLLTFDFQEQLAEQSALNFADPADAMRAYFRHARDLHRAANRMMDSVETRGNTLLAGFRDWRSRLSNSEFTVSRDRILFKLPQQLTLDPSSVLRLFELVARHKLELHGETERRLAEHRQALTEYFRSPRDLWTGLHNLLSLPYASRALHAMHETGVLKILFPEWEQIECYVVRDFHHRYTVDEHTLLAIQNLEALRDSPQSGHERFANLLTEIEDTAILRLALIFHDIGKGGSEAGHAAVSAQLATAAAERIQMPEPKRRLLHDIVKGHLDLSSAMVSRDLDDPKTAEWLAHRVGTIEVLKYLTLITYADTGAVNPTALSPWRLEQLWRVYLTCHHELTRELDAERIEAFTGSSPDLQAFLKGFPTRYLRIHSEADIEKHMLLEERRRDTGIAIDIERQNSVYTLTVLAKDRLFLFASMAGALAAFGMNIVKAEAFANQQGTILDTFAFTDPQRTLELNPQEKDRLEQTLERVLLGKVEVKALLRNRPKPSAPSKGSRLSPRVAFDSEASATATLIEVVAQDRPGLLYDLASIISEAGCSIDVVLVDTEAHKALDVFYVTSHGRKLDTALQSTLHERLVAACSA